MMIKSKADKLVFIYAHKDHTRSMLNGGTLEDVVQHANELSKTSPGGALCPIIVMSGDEELRWVGPAVYDDELWNAGIEIWLAAAKVDPDVLRLMK